MLIRRLFNEQEATSILQMPLSKMGEMDKQNWIHTKSGIFFVNSAYKWLAKLRNQNGSLPESSYRREHESKM